MKNKKAKPKIFHYDSFLKNRRGDIPVTILVIGVVGICILAILSFSFSLGAKSNALSGPYLIEDSIAISEQINFYEEKGISFENLINKKTSDSGALLNITKNIDGGFLIREESRNSKGLVFSVEYNFKP